MNAEEVVGSALVLIANHYPRHDLSPSWIGEQLGISPADLDSAFLRNRSTTCGLSIQTYRLSRLFERITVDPETPLLKHVLSCGLHSIQSADEQFQTSFGITLTAFHSVSERACADRLHRRNHPHPSDLIINE